MSSLQAISELCVAYFSCIYFMWQADAVHVHGAAVGGGRFVCDALLYAAVQHSARTYNPSQLSHPVNLLPRAHACIARRCTTTESVRGVAPHVHEYVHSWAHIRMYRAKVRFSEAQRLNAEHALRSVRRVVR